MPNPTFPTHRIAILLVEGFALMSFAAVTEPLRAANLLAGRRIYDLSFSPPGQRPRRS